RLIKGQAILERTAAVIWSVLEQITSPIFLWNVFPLHPHEPGVPFSNRVHNSRERMAGEELLEMLVDYLKPKKIVAIGNDAEKAAIRIKGHCKAMKVRHPSYGGQNIFLEQIRSIYNIEEMSALGSDHWSGIGLERAHPLPGMLGAGPAVPVRPDIASGTGGEGGCFRSDPPGRA
ncbi:uracil-DNA glycosylase, partial [Rhizobium sp. UGM030330-04]